MSFFFNFLHVFQARDYLTLSSSVGLQQYTEIINFSTESIASRGEEVAAKLDFINQWTFMYQNDLAVIPSYLLYTWSLNLLYRSQFSTTIFLDYSTGKSLLNLITSFVSYKYLLLNRFGSKRLGFYFARLRCRSLIS